MVKQPDLGFAAAVANDTAGECMGSVYCERCKRRHGYCHDVTEQLTGIKGDPGKWLQPGKPYRGSIYDTWEQQDKEQQEMDLGKQRSKSSGKGGKKFEQRDWVDVTDLPRKPSQWKVDDFRAAKKGSKLIGFLDITLGSKKRTMGLRKGFNLDNIMDQLGTNTDKWKGKKLELERGGSDDQYVNVSRG